MNRVDELRAARNGYSVSFMAFLKVIAEGGDFLICFFEGKDIKYYGPRLTMLRPDLQWKSIPCGGKKAVLKVRDIIMTNENYRDSNVAFFVDYDYGLWPLTETRNLYETPCYSIENFYVSLQTFMQVLESEYGLSPHLEDEHFYNLCRITFQQRLSDFLEAVETLNAWVLAHRRRELSQQIHRELEADEIKLNRYFDITLERVQATYTVSELQNAFNLTYTPTETEISEIIKEIPSELRCKMFRGKFLAYFLMTFLARLADDSVKDTPTYFPSKRRGCLRPTERNFLSELSQYAETPNCLRQFIERQSSGLN